MDDLNLIEAYLKANKINRPWNTIGRNVNKVDNESLIWFKRLLENRGEKVEIAEDKYSLYDLYGSGKLGNKYYIECKTIDCRSDKWKDVKIDAKKIDRLIESEVPSYIVLFFEDGWIILDVKDIERKVENNRCNTTTAWSGSKIIKQQYSIKHRNYQLRTY